MANMTKKEMEKLQKQMTTNKRGETFVGFRACTFKSKKYDKKASRRESKKLCKEEY